MTREALSKFKTLATEAVKAMREPDGIHATFAALLATGYKPA
jgi:hypothetical protein